MESPWCFYGLLGFWQDPGESISRDRLIVPLPGKWRQSAQARIEGSSGSFIIGAGRRAMWCSVNKEVFTLVSKLQKAGTHRSIHVRGLLSTQRKEQRSKELSSEGRIEGRNWEQGWKCQRRGCTTELVWKIKVTSSCYPHPTPTPRAQSHLWLCELVSLFTELGNICKLVIAYITFTV